MKKTITLICIIFFLYSCCNNKDGVNYIKINLSHSTIINPQLISINKIYSDIYDIRIIDSLIIIKSDDGYGCLQLINKKNNKYIKTKGIYGRGPGEFKNSLIEIKNIHDSLYLYDLTTNSISRYCIDNIIADSIFIPNKLLKIKGYKGNYDIFPVGNYYISRPAYKCRFILFDDKGVYLNKYNEFPIISKKTNQVTTEYALRQLTFVEPNPNKSRFVSITYLGAMIEYFKISGSNIVKESEFRYLKPNIKNSNNILELINDDVNIGFYSLQTTEKYLYAGYSGLKFKHFKEKQFLVDYLVVFDWNGNIVKTYYIKGGFSKFAIDKDQKSVYIVTKNSNYEDVIGYFKI